MSAAEIGNSSILEKKKTSAYGLSVCLHYNAHFLDDIRHHMSMPAETKPSAAFGQLLVVVRPWSVPEL